MTLEATSVVLTEAETSDRNVSHRRRWSYVAVLMALVVMTGSLAFVAGRVTSPAQRAAQAQAPQRATLTANLQWGPLRDSVVFRATIEFAGTRKISIAAPGGSEQAIVTKVRVKPGQQLSPGAQIAEISGHPVVALASSFGPYRDLHAGDRGPDVSAVQRNLRRLGLPVGSEASLDRRTARGIDLLLGRLGYSATPRSEAPSSTERGTAAAEPAPRLVLPASYWIAIREGERRIAAAELQVGQDLAAAPASISVTSGTKVVSVQAEPGDNSRLVAGLRATFIPDSGRALDGRLVDVTAKQPPADAGRLVVSMAGLAAVPVGTTGRLEAFVVETAAVLSAPVTALRSRPDGTVVLRVRRPGGDVDVEVTTGAQAKGSTQVSGAGLRRDDLVVLP